MKNKIYFLIGMVSHWCHKTNPISPWTDLPYLVFSHRLHSTSCCSLWAILHCNMTIPLLFVGCYHENLTSIFYNMKQNLIASPRLSMFHIVKCTIPCYIPCDTQLSLLCPWHILVHDISRISLWKFQTSLSSATMIACLTVRFPTN